VLRVNLSDGKVDKEELRWDLVEKFLGGRGLAGAYLYDELKPAIEPFSPENKVIFMTGPLGGSIWPTANKLVITFKSPLTNIFGDSLVGADLSMALKLAGYDGIIVEGRSEKPCFLWVNDNKVSLQNAEWLWGLPTIATQSLVKDAVGQPLAKTLAIGPAGERLVRFACIVAQAGGVGGHRAAGRCGCGAVLGYKKMKAIAVHGTGKIGQYLAKPEEFLKTVREASRSIVANPMCTKIYRTYGTTSLVDTINGVGAFPTRNFQSTVFEDADKINAETFRKRVWTKDVGCYLCPVHCAKVAVVREGPYLGAYTGTEPEYETVWALGAMVGNSDPNSIVAGNMYCDEYGMDTISTGGVIAFAMELYQRGIITTEDTDGLELTWGNCNAIIKMIHKIAFREGIGDILAEGTMRAAKRIGKGSEKYAMQVKGLELAGYDPRGIKSIGAVYATVSSRGGCHHSGGYTPYGEILGRGWKEDWGPLDRFREKGKAQFIVTVRDYRQVFDTLGACVFTSLDLEHMARAASLAIGRDFDVQTLRKCAARTANLERAFNVREGITRKDDKLPERLLKEPAQGSSQGQTINLNILLDEYFELVGWDKKTGIPTRKTLEELDLKYVADEMEKMGKLPR